MPLYNDYAQTQSRLKSQLDSRGPTLTSPRATYTSGASSFEPGKALNNMSLRQW